MDDDSIRSQVEARRLTWKTAVIAVFIGTCVGCPLGMLIPTPWLFVLVLWSWIALFVARKRRERNQFPPVPPAKALTGGLRKPDDV
jgi:hypothetical protein